MSATSATGVACSAVCTSVSTGTPTVSRTSARVESPSAMPTPRKEEPEEREYALQKVKATVVDLACGVRTVGLQPPKTITEFAVAFQSATGQVYRFTIPEEMYEGLEKGQTGILSFIDGELYGFDLGETEA